MMMTVFGTYMRLIYKRGVLLTMYDTDVSDDEDDEDVE
jgi:hypothetical protein